MSDDYEDHMVQEVDETEEVEESEPEEEEVFEEETEAQEVEEESTEETQEAEEDQDQEDSGDDEDYDKPVSEGDVVELEIEDLGSKGDGIARVEGFVVFVPGGEVDQKYDVEITSVGRKFAFGEITE